MTVDKSNNIALLLTNGRDIIPIHVDALKAASGSPRHIRKNNEGAAVIFSNGEVKRINKIKVLKPLGDRWYGKLFNFLNFGWEISIQYESLNFSHAEKVAIVLERLVEDQKKPEPYVKIDLPLGDVAERLRQTSTVLGIFEALNLSDDSEILDIL